MAKEAVALVKCNTYEKKEVFACVNEAIDSLGGLRHVIHPGMTVFIKINLLMKKNPEDQVTTNPMVVAAIAKYVESLGAKAIVGDSPAGLFNERALKGIYDRCGITAMAENENITLNYDVSTQDVFYEDAAVLKKFVVAKAIYEADAVITVGKLKTHGMTAYTGAVKNLFGCIPGLTKAEYHFRMPKLIDFSNMLVDIATFINPVFSIIDAVYGMEGNGPSAGTPRKIGAIITGFNPHAVDAVAISLTNAEPMSICTIQRANERGLFSGNINDVDVIGAKISQLIVKDFEQAKSHGTSLIKGHIPRIFNSLTPMLEGLLTTKPVIERQKCKGCRDCYNTCPAKAIEMIENKAVIDYSKCIKCFCCQEICPYMAVDIKKSWVLRLLSR